MTELTWTLVRFENRTRASCFPRRICMMCGKSAQPFLNKSEKEKYLKEGVCHSCLSEEAQ
tara:strand:- start:214 stop:393 length:180 start_codon:yes stop_codon:yes gene_type:complete